MKGGAGRWVVTLMMPGIFLAIHFLSRWFFRRFLGAWGAVGFAFGVPFIWYLGAMSSTYWRVGEFGTLVFGVLMSLSVAMFLGGLAWLCDWLVRRPWLAKGMIGYYIVAGLVGLVLPIGGLLLNRKISFPVDFQSFDVYVLCVVNGLVWLWRPVGELWIGLRLFLRCLVLPFVVYFFLVFLPYLPLSIVAIIFFGAGFLMLAPLLLGMFAGRIVWLDFGLALKVLGRSRTIAIVFCGVLMFPGYFMGQALLDKQALELSLDYF